MRYAYIIIIVKNIVNIYVFPIVEGFQTGVLLDHIKMSTKTNAIRPFTTTTSGNFKQDMLQSYVRHPEPSLDQCKTNNCTASPRGCNHFPTKNFKRIPSTRRNRYSKEKQHNIHWTKLHLSRD